MKIIKLYMCILMIAFIMGLTRCSAGPEDGPTVPLKQLVEKGGKFYQKGSEKPFTGKALETYPNGKKKNVIHVRDGVMTGECISYHIFGTGYYKGKLKNMERDGTWVFYDENDRLSYKSECHWQVRSYVRQSIAELKKANYEKARELILKALKVKALANLKWIEAILPGIQGNYCYNNEHFECAIKYEKLFHDRLIEHKADKIVIGISAYRVGHYCWRLATQNNSSLSTAEKLELIDEGIRFLDHSNQSIEKGYSYPHAIKCLLYREKAKLDSSKADEYSALAAKEKENFNLVIKKIRERNELIRQGKEEIDYDTPKKKSWPNLFEPVDKLEDNLFDMIAEYDLSFPLPPPPPFTPEWSPKI